LSLKLIALVKLVNHSISPPGVQEEDTGYMQDRPARSVSFGCSHDSANK